MESRQRISVLDPNFKESVLCSYNEGDDTDNGDIEPENEVCIVTVLTVIATQPKTIFQKETKIPMVMCKIVWMEKVPLVKAPIMSEKATITERKEKKAWILVWKGQIPME